MRTRFPEEHGSFSEETIQGLTAEELHQLCRNFGVGTFIITLGGSGCLVSTNEAFFEVPPLSGVEVVDTTGAGDAFVGGLASGLVQFDGNIEKAVHYGTVVAGLSVTQFGTAPAMPSKAAIDREIETQGFEF